MQLSESKIKQAILHSEEEVRVTAVSYFSDSHSTDPEIMPLVIQAVEKYGQNSAFRILRDAESLKQSPSTLDWLIDQLRQDFDITKINDDNLRFAIALVILAAPINLLEKRKADIDALVNFPEELRGVLDDRLRMAMWTWGQRWKALEEIGRKTLRKGDFNRDESNHASRIIEALAQYPGDRSDTVLALLRREYPAKGKRLMRWLEPQIIELVGEMRLEAAIPILVEHLSLDDLSISDSAATALMRIGTNAVVRAIVDDWRDQNDDYRGGAADVLEKIHTNLSVQTCLELLEDEDEFDTAFALAHALLSHFSFEGIEPVQGFFMIDKDEWSNDHYDLKYHFIAAATIMEVRFQEYDSWYREAVQTNWGWGDFERSRLADAFQPDPVEPKQTGRKQDDCPK